GSAWALVTGAGSGIGRCYAQQLAALGYNLVLAGITAQTLDQTRDTCHIQGIEVHTVVIDLARTDASQELFEAVQALGIEIDVLINNAGIFSFLDLLQTPVERIERIILLHDLTTTLNCRRFAERMVQRGVQGYILNMSSYSLWMPFPGLSLYSASKAYLRSFSVAFAKEVRQCGILVTAVCPAGVATDLYGLPRRWQQIGCKVGVLISPTNCAHRGLTALWRGRRCIVPDWWNRLWIPLCKLLPMCVLRPIRKKTMKFQK
ncbi:MAG: SDR family NAD(P)-dependent oxidoreductase, partial [Alistipes sp.]